MAISNVTDWDEIEADPDFPSLSQESRAKLFDDWEKKFSRTLLEGADLDKVKPEGLNRLAATNAVRRRKLAGEDVSDPNVAAKTWNEQKQAEAKLAQQTLKDYADVEDKQFRLDDARSMPGVDEFGRAAPWWEEGVAKATKDLESAEAKLVPEVRAQAQAASEALKGKRKIATLNGNIYTDPALVLNKDEFRQQVLDSDAPPEAKALKLASFQSEKKRYLDEAINTLTKGDPQIPLAESFPKFLESKGFDLDQEMVKQSEGKLDYSPIQKQRELAQEYLTKMQDRGWFRKIGSALSTGVASGMLDIGTQAVGTAAMLTGDEEKSKVAAELSRASGDIGAAQGLEGDMQATGGTFAGGVSRLGTNMAPMLLPGGAVGGIARLAGAGAGAATAAAVGASALTAGAQTAGSQFGEVYDHLRQQGSTHEQAFGVSRNAAVLSGAVTTALTALGGATGVESLLRQGGKDLVKSRLVAALKAVPGGAAKEIAEELPDEYVSQLVSAFAKDPNASPSQVTDEFAANAPDLILQIAALGGAGSGVGRFKETTTDPTKTAQEQEFPAAGAPPDLSQQDRDNFAQGGVPIFDTEGNVTGYTTPLAAETTASNEDIRKAAEEAIKPGIPVEVEGVTIATINPESGWNVQDVLDFANSPEDMATLARNKIITLPEVVAPIEGVDPAITAEMNERVAASAAIAPQTVEALKAAPTPEVQAEIAEPIETVGAEAAEASVAEPVEEVNETPPPVVDLGDTQLELVDSDEGFAQYEARDSEGVFARFTYMRDANGIWRPAPGTRLTIAPRARGKGIARRFIKAFADVVGAVGSTGTTQAENTSEDAQKMWKALEAEGATVETQKKVTLIGQNKAWVLRKKPAPAKKATPAAAETLGVTPPPAPTLGAPEGAARNAEMLRQAAARAAGTEQGPRIGFLQSPPAVTTETETPINAANVDGGSQGVQTESAEGSVPTVTEDTVSISDIPSTAEIQPEVRENPTPEEKAELEELDSLMERRGQAQNKVKGATFSKKDEARFQELGAKLRRFLFETVDAANDAVVGEDINGQPIRQSKNGTLYTVENGRVRTAPAFKPDPEYSRQQDELLAKQKAAPAVEEAPASEEWSPTPGQPATANINGQKVVGTVGPSTGGGLVSFQYEWNGKPQKAVVRPERLARPVASLTEPPSYQYTQEQNSRKAGKHFPTAPGVHANHDFRKSFASMAEDTSLSRIYRQIAEIMSKMDAFANIDLHIVADGDIGYAGEYSHSNGKSSIAVNLRQVARGKVDALGTILHEALHHITLAKVRNPQGAFETEVVAKLDTIRKRVKEYAKQQGLGKRLGYELNTLEEFISALTSPDFQNFLASIPDSFSTGVSVGKFRSALSEVFRLIAELIKGEPVARGSTMEQYFTTVLALFETPHRTLDIGKLEKLSAVQSGVAQATPESLRHAELEAKFNAGTITPEETAEAQALVDERAKASGYNVGPVWHHGGFDASVDAVPRVGEEGMHFGTEDAARQRAYGKLVDDFVKEGEVTFDDDLGAWFWSSQGVDSYDVADEEGFASKEDAQASLEQFASHESDDPGDASELGTFTKAYLKAGDAIKVDDQKDSWHKAVAKAKKQGVGAIEYRNLYEDKGSTSYIVFEPNQIKSADPFTGVPLDQRFDKESNDIRASLAEQPERRGYRTPADMLAEAAQKAKGEAVGTKPQGLASMFKPQAKRPATGERKLLDMPVRNTLANAYREAVRGSSTQFAPLSSVYAQARLLQPGLTPEAFLAQVQEGYDNGTLLLEGAGSQQEAAQAGLSLPGTPVGTAVRMMPAPETPKSVAEEPDHRESDAILGVMMEDGRFEEGVKMFDKAKRANLGAPPQPSPNTNTPPRFTSPAQFAAAFEAAFLRGDYDYFLEALKQADRHIYVPEMKRYINASKLGDTDAAERLEWFRHAIAGTIPANVKPQTASAPPPAAVGSPTTPPPPTVTPPPKAGASNRPMLTLNTPAMGLIAKMLGASIRINTLLRRARGRIKLSMADGSEIELSKHLFKDPVQAAKTLAHEIGHLFDFLPASGFTKTLAHKLAPLGDFRKVFGNDLADWFMDGGKKIKPSKITQLIKPELVALSKKWRGDFSPSDKYRGSGKELYADFISAILNDPMWAAKNAPYATLGFLNALEQKPEVEQAYQLLVSLVQGGSLYKALAEADQGRSTTALERLIAKSSALMRAKKTLNDATRGLYRSMFGKWLPTAIRDGGIWKSYWNRLKGIGTSKDYNWAQEEASQFAVRQITRFDNDLANAVGIPLKLAGIDPDYLQRLQTNNRIIHERRRVGKLIEEDPVKARALLKWMVDAGLLGKDVQAEVDSATDDELYALTAKVIGMMHANGDSFERALKAARRKGAPADAEKALYAFDVSGFMLNPKVLTMESAEADNADIEQTLGPDQFAELQRINEGYHDLVKRTMVDAYKLGLFRKSTWDDVIEPNFGVYVPFTPIKYFTGHVKGGLGPARVGTAHDLMAPHVVGTLKMHALIRRMQQQKQALLLLDFFNNTGLSKELEPVEDEDFDRIKAEELTKLSKHTISYVPYWDEGEYKWVKVNGTDAVTLMQNSDPDDLAALYKVLRSNTQMWRLNYTIFSIAFNVANTLRNIATPFVDIGPKAGYKAAKQLLSVFPQMAKWVWARIAGKDPASVVAASIAVEHALHKPGMPVSKELQEFYDRDILQPMPDAASLRMSQEELARSVIGAMSSPEFLLQGAHKAAKDMKWYDNTLKQYLHSAVDVMSFIGSVSEAAPKIAAYQALKEKKDSKGKPAFTDAQATYLATLEGIPRPGVAGAHNAALEMVLMFFRVAVQSWRKHLIMATAPQTRAGFLMRHMLFESAKFGLQAMAANGAIDYLIALGAAAAAGGDDDDPEKFKQVDWAEAMDRQSSYKLSHGGIGPLLGWVLPDGSVEPPWGHKSIPADWVPIMPRLPGTELSREADPLAYYATSKTMAPMIAPVNDDVFWNDFVRSVIPSLNPTFEVASDAMSVLGPTPPRDSYRGREKVEQRLWDEGYIARVMGLGEHHLKSFGLGSNPYDTPLPGAWNVLKQPGVKTLLASDNMVGVREEQRARHEDELTSSFAQNMVGEKFDKLKKTFNRLKSKSTPRTREEERVYDLLQPVMSKGFYGTEKRDGKYDVLQSYARLKAKGLQDTPGGKILKAEAEQATKDLERIADDLQKPLEFIRTHTLP